MNKIKAYIHLSRLNRPVGIYLVLWPALWALWLASEGLPSTWLLCVFTVGALLMRSAGCVINDYADRHFDAHVERTCQRPLATGVLSEKEALVFFAALCLIAFALVLTLNTLTIGLSLGAVLLAALYPFMKRYTYWPQAFLGAAFAWAVPMAFAAVQADLPWQLWPVFVVTLVWSLIYDTAYAVGDMRDDVKIGIKSTAILFGSYLIHWIALFQLVMVGLLLWIGILFEMHWPFFASVVFVIGWFLFDLWRLTQMNTGVAFKIFLQNHWVGFIVLLGIVVDYGFIGR